MQCSFIGKSHKRHLGQEVFLFYVEHGIIFISSATLSKNILSSMNNNLTTEQFLNHSHSLIKSLTSLKFSTTKVND